MKRSLLIYSILSFSLFAVFSIAVLLLGENPFYIFYRLFRGTLGNYYGIGQIIFKASPVIFAGLSSAFAFRTGLFNVGMEGQGYLGGFFMAMAGIYLDLPWFLLFPACLLAGFLGGGLLGAFAGFLKIKYGVHEVISTIMLNFISIAFVNYLLLLVRMPETMHTKEIASGAFIPKLENYFSVFRGSSANFSFLLAVLTVLAVYFIYKKTMAGFEFGMIRENPVSANAYGINVGSRSVLSMFIAGGISGLAGSGFILGYKHYFEAGFMGNAGLTGIAASLMAFNNPFGIVLSALFIGFLSHGSLVINAHVPKEIMDVIQAMSIIFVVSVHRSKK